MADYKLVYGSSDVRRVSDGTVIPHDPRNRDYQAYQAWLQAGNTPDPAPAPPQPSVIATTDFLARFTDAELLAVAALVRGSDAIFVWYTKMVSGPTVNLLSTDTKTALDLVVGAGGLTSDRETTILTP